VATVKEKEYHNFTVLRWLRLCCCHLPPLSSSCCEGAQLKQNRHKSHSPGGREATTQVSKVSPIFTIFMTISRRPPLLEAILLLEFCALLIFFSS
jgi:hypothetical protein